MLVEEPKGHEEEPAAHAERVSYAPIDVELLDLELAHIRRRRHRVLDLILGVEFGARIEGVAEAEHRTRKIRLRLAVLPRRVGVVHLAVTP